ncbi:MAG: flagellar biosynthesis protein FlhF [Lachnospiraceae bacterium]|nr:flagellar biosynthesis protein FlhF [uncultured Acetatifactor sp.]MCI8798937.1 flagellar biosynthesis protein FlhF [Lachnospiraceae bacterium]
MIIKKFVGKTEEEAVEAARKELGSGAVIMNVRLVKRKGLGALLGGKRTEVTAALEEESDTINKARSTADFQTQAGTEGQSPAQTAPRNPESVLAGNNRLSTQESQAIEKKLDSLQQLLVNRFQQSEEERKDALDKGDMAAEGESEEEGQEITEQQRFIRLLYNTMLRSEVDEKYANQIVDEIDVTGQPNMPLDRILANVYQKMILKFGRAEGITPVEGAPKIVFFMGPTGVGKTTTIAKIASSISVDEKKKVALLTADTYRIAAAEQLRTYANILEIPFRIIYSEEEALEAVREFQTYDFIFVDTAGHSHKNEDQMGNTVKLLEALKSAGECQVFLVLSATTKYRDLLKIVSSYEEFTEFQLIFTKLDETMTMGNLLNMKLFMGTPIAFVTNGQDVPNDIEQFNPQKTVKQILSTKQERNS